MVMRIRLLVIVTIVMVVMLTACGGSTPTEQADPTDAPTSVPSESTPEETPVSEAVDAVVTEAATSEIDGEEPAASGVPIARVSFPQTSARSGPGTSFDPVLAVTVNQEFPVIAQSGSGTTVWYLVDLGDGQLGWLWSNVVAIVPEDALIEAAATVPAP